MNNFLLTGGFMEYFVYMTNDCNLKCKYCSVLLDCEKNSLPIKPTYSYEALISFIKNTQITIEDDEISIYFLLMVFSLDHFLC